MRLVAALAFGMRDGFLRLLDQSLDLGRGGYARRRDNPGAYAHPDLTSVEQGDVGVENSFQDALGDLFGILPDDPGQDDQEHVPFVAPDPVVRPALLADPPGDDRQHIVADIRPIFLVDLLQVVDIQSDQAERSLRPTGAFQLAARENEECLLV